MSENGPDPGQRYTDEQVASLPVERQPRPFTPFKIDTGGSSRQVLARRSGEGTRWCSFCQTPLAGGRSSACDDCAPRRRASTKRRGGDESNATAELDTGVGQEVAELLAAIDEMNRTATVVFAVKENHPGGYPRAVVDDLLLACKTVTYRAIPLQDRPVSSTARNSAVRPERR